MYKLLLDRRVEWSEGSDLRHHMLTVIAVPGVSLGDLRPVKAWNFERNEPRRGPKRKPTREVEGEDGEVSRDYALKKAGVYLCDSCSEENERAFYYLLATDDIVDILERREVAEHFFLQDGLDKLSDALGGCKWASARELLEYAACEDLEVLYEELFTRILDALSKQKPVPLEGRPKQLSWAQPLREQALGQLRAVWRNFVVSPELVKSNPDLRFSLLTAAWNMRLEQYAAVWIAADFHITRGNVTELVDRFAANGKRLHVEGRAAPALSDADRELVRRLAGSRQPQFR